MCVCLCVAAHSCAVYARFYLGWVAYNRFLDAFHIEYLVVIFDRLCLCFFFTILSICIAHIFKITGVVFKAMCVNSMQWSRC